MGPFLATHLPVDRMNRMKEADGGLVAEPVYRNQLEKLALRMKLGSARQIRFRLERIRDEREIAAAVDEQEQHHRDQRPREDADDRRTIVGGLHQSPHR